VYLAKTVIFILLQEIVDNPFSPQYTPMTRQPSDAPSTAAVSSPIATAPQLENVESDIEPSKV
jgi:hypothetical protein